VAKLVKIQNPQIVVGALAYADVWDPPRNIEKLTDNVQVEVCMYGASNLPTASKVNAGLRRGFLDWRKKVARMETYDYALLHTENWQQDPQIPVAMVKGIVDRAKFLAGIDALSGGTQASLESYPYNPWNYYAYPHIRLYPDQTAKQLVKDFFFGYFREAAQPMLNYYLAIEEYQIKNDIDMRFLGACFCYGIAPGSFPPMLLAKMERYLRQAEGAAVSWFVKRRIALIREGFDWILTKRGLQRSKLDDISMYPIVGKVPISIDLAQGVQPDLGKRGNFSERGTINGTPCWVFWAQGVMYQSLYFPKAGRYTVKVKAAAITADTIWPIMNLYLGPKQIGRVEVVTPKGEYNEYDFEVYIPKGFGVQDFLVSYQNAAEGGARNLFIKNVSFVAKK
jgi:hypothetical protein